MDPQRKSVFLHSLELEKYSYPDSSPFKTQRAALTRKTLLSMGLLDGISRVEIPPHKASRDELEGFHTPAYLDAVQAAERGDLTPVAFAMGLGTPDCPIFKGMYDYACWAAGASITGAELLLAGEAHVAFNPSGGFHHAQAAKAAGFCYINDAVLAALVFTKSAKRVLFLDLDVHHCDGVQAAFYNRYDVLTISLHESGNSLFPGTGFEDEIGAGPGEGFTVNIPLPAGTYDAAYVRAFKEAALPLIRAYSPDFIIMEIGMDALAGDPLAHLQLTNNAYAEVIGLVSDFGRPLLALGGGGYNVENTVRGWTLAWSVMCGDSAADWALAMGGVMLQNTEWFGGLRDRQVVPDTAARIRIEEQINATVARIRERVFPYHGL